MLYELIYQNQKYPDIKINYHDGEKTIVVNDNVEFKQMVPDCTNLKIKIIFEETSNDEVKQREILFANLMSLPVGHSIMYNKDLAFIKSMSCFSLIRGKILVY